MLPIPPDITIEIAERFRLDAVRGALRGRNDDLIDLAVAHGGLVGVGPPGRTGRA